MFIWILTILMLFALEIAYLKLADRLNIIDKPNLRSSHTIPVVRGGGLIFPLAWLIMSVYSGWKFPWFTSGLLILSVISFRDDMRPLSAGQRFIFHIIASIFLFAELSILDAHMAHHYAAHCRDWHIECHQLYGRHQRNDRTLCTLIPFTRFDPDIFSLRTHGVEPFAIADDHAQPVHNCFWIF